jgi:hypothetical protein
MRYSLCLCLALCCTTISAQQAAHTAWWDNFPLIVETNNLSKAQEHHATVGMCASQNDPTWGLYGQKLLENRKRTMLFQLAGMKVISYSETFGQSYCFVAEISEASKEPRTHWSWQQYGGGDIHWIGIHNYFDDEPFARPYTRTHPRFGSPPMTYPDGSVATGYIGPATDPRNSRVLDACVSKNILGKLSMELHFNQAVNKVDPKTGKPTGPLDGLLPINDQHCSLIMFQKDSACPLWIDYASASMRHAAEAGLDGIWSDNFGPWDSMGNPAIKNGFGDWSVFGFRDYLRKNFTSRQLRKMGVRNTSRFDIRRALRDKVKAWGGDDTNLKDAAWRDLRWLDEPLWRAYVIYKRQTGTRALSRFYKVVKQAAREAGKPDFLVAGNDIPGFSLGWPRGDLDMVSTEIGTAWALDAGKRGIMLPPLGRQSPRYKLAREHARSRFVNVWLYKDGDEKHLGNSGLTEALYYEMLACHALPMLHPDNVRCAGNQECNKQFFTFLTEAKQRFGARVPIHPEIGVYYSSSSLLAHTTPGGHADFNRQPHQFAFYGWCTALEELHAPYRPIPEWKISKETLDSLRVLIIPNAEVLDPQDVRKTLLPWVESGGKLIITGNSGLRLGEEGNFSKNPKGLSTATLTDCKTVVLNTIETPGLEFYLQEEKRSAFREKMQDALTRVCGEDTLMVCSAPPTVSVNLYEDIKTKQLFIDINNLDIDVKSDAMKATPPIKLSVKRPSWLTTTKLKASVLSPDKPPLVSLKNSEDRIVISLGPLQLYASIIIGPCP